MFFTLYWLYAVSYTHLDVYKRQVEDLYETKGFDNFILKIDHTYAEESILNASGKIDYGSFKPILFEMPGYTYLKTGDTAAKCMTLGKETK